MTRHGICVQARHEPCTYCKAKEEQPCTAGRPGVHFCRVCRTWLAGRITYRDEISVAPGGVFDGRLLVLDPEVA
jgi:hypothetical protein